MIKVKYIAFLICTLAALLAYPQEPEKNLSSYTREEVLNMTYDDLLKLSLEDLLMLAKKVGLSVDELLNMKITVSSQNQLTPRESPGIVTVLTDDDLQKMGVRDFEDVIRIVPGFFVAADVGGVNGLGLRGIWGHEGKILVLIDGIEFNELRYAANQIGNHISIDQIKRIELIRGPGSVIYGGYAELSVINIITKKGGEINGASGSFTLGKLDNVFGRRSSSLNIGKKWNNWEISAHGFIGDGFRTEGIYESFYPSDVDSTVIRNTDTLRKGNGRVKTANANIALRYRNLSARFVYDYYQTQAIDYTSYSNIFRTRLGELKYEFKPNEKLTITPKLLVKQNTPWYTPGYSANEYIWRFTENVTFNYNISKEFSLVGGEEFYHDRVEYIKKDDSTLVFYNGKNHIEFNNTAAFLQGVLKLKSSNLTIGGRFENHSVYGSSIAPRIGYTQIINNFHFKLLLSKAFHSPNIGSIEMNKDIEPEETYVYEAEAGYRFDKKSFVTVNLFNIKINKPIYYWDGGATWGYKNGLGTGSRGVEAEYNFRTDDFFLTLSYAYYNAQGLNKDTVYMVPYNKQALLGAPQHKVSGVANFKLADNISITTSFTYYGQVHGLKNMQYEYSDVLDSTGAVVGTDSVLTPYIDKFKSALVASVVMNFENIFTKGLTLSVAIYDVLNEKPYYVQAYNGYGAPWPGRGREFLLKLKYNFKTK